MSFLDELDNYAHRLSHWPDLLQGGRLFTELRALHPEELPEAARILEKCSNDPRLKLHPQQQVMLQTVLACAQIAALDHYNYQRLKAQLRLIDPTIELPEAFQKQLERVPSGQWSQVLHSALHYVNWTPPLCTAWAWDTILRFWKYDRQVVHHQHITLLLVDGKNQGVAADLVMELLAKGNGEFYPDPGNMWYPAQRPDFQQALEKACELVSNRGLWPTRQDIRWSVARQDGGPLDVLDGGSAGAAFALTLAKLLVEGRELFSERSA
jgi:hypothetical protein